LHKIEAGVYNSCSKMDNEKCGKYLAGERKSRDGFETHLYVICFKGNIGLLFVLHPKCRILCCGMMKGGGIAKSVGQEK